ALYKVRGRFWLEGTLEGVATDPEPVRSETFSGDLYLRPGFEKLNPAERTELQRRMQAAVKPWRPDPRHWPRPTRDTPRRDLGELLDEVYQDRFDAFNAVGEVVRRLRAENVITLPASEQERSVGLILTSDDRASLTPVVLVPDPKPSQLESVLGAGSGR